jgi:hypothetical protein
MQEASESTPGVAVHGVAVRWPDQMALWFASGSLMTGSSGGTRRHYLHTGGIAVRDSEV